jgi:hypothetical protein
MRYYLFIIAMFSCTISYGQNAGCRTDELFTYLKSKGVASEGDQNFIKCSPIIIETNGDGVYQFGVDETHAFTYFYIFKDNKISFVDSNKIENTMTEISAYLKQANLPLEKKISCYETISNIMKEEKLSFPWKLEEKN